MEYDRIILEMLDRIKKLEAEVELLKNDSGIRNADNQTDKPKVSKKYRRLTEKLLNSQSKKISLSFTDIETIIESSLPESAYTYRAFWANTTSHSIAHGWLAAGYKVVDVNMDAETVTFEKEPGK